jgi:arabinofuranosyltransferase
LSPSADRPSRPLRILRASLLAAFAVVVLLNAWIGDDAYITWRTIDHLVHGRGLVYNLGERVQTFTHPLWLALLTALHLITREAWWTTIAASLLCSVAALTLVAHRLTASAWSMTAILLAAASSRAFVEYSTSGLENCLAHLVLAATLVVYFDREPGARTLTWLTLGCSALILCRPDLALVGLPLVVAGLLAARRRGASKLRRALAVGLAPLVAWEIFSLVYYGALVPNTALAKLGVGIPRGELVAQGLRYLRYSLEVDPITPLTIAAGLAVVVLRRDRAAAPLAAASILYLAFIVWIGGDFMAGRFLTVPFLLALVTLARTRPTPRIGGLRLAAVVAIALLGDRHPMFTRPGDHWRPGDPRDHLGVADERSFYAESSSVLAWRPGRSLPDHRWRRLGEAGPADRGDFVVFSTPGFYGYHARPELHIVDGFALLDPLLARLPAVRRDDWRPGHFSRPLPDGYLDARRTGRAELIRDPAVADLHRALQLVIAGPIWHTDRWLAIMRLHSGHYTAAIDRDAYRTFAPRRR